VTQIFDKLGVATRAEAIVLARDHGIGKDEEPGPLSRSGRPSRLPPGREPHDEPCAASPCWIRRHRRQLTREAPCPESSRRSTAPRPYLVFLLSFLYAVAWLGHFLVPQDDRQRAGAGTGRGAGGEPGAPTAFALQHSIMARPGFKRWWTRLVPPPVERATYVLFAACCSSRCAWAGARLPQVVWHAEGGAAIAICGRSSPWAGSSC
jgi:hypothetical protein